MKRVCENEHLVWDFVFLNDIYAHLRPFLCPVSHLCLAFTSHAHRKHSGAIIRKDSLCSEIAKTGSIHLMEWAAKLAAPRPYQAAWRAAGGGHLELLKWLHLNGYPFAAIDTTAALHGHIHILDWYYWQYRDVSGYRVTRSAIEGDHLDVLKWILKTRPDTNFGKAFEALSPRNSDDVICWPYENGQARLPELPPVAIKKDSVPLIERLLKAGCDWTEECTYWARKVGSIALLEWAKTRELIK
jgi:hypothetical protein